MPAVGPEASAGPGVPDLAGYSVALLNRGTPGSLVAPDGTLHISLMRSCSAWPCGVWIDGDARTTPDGTSFAWQHWSHTFEYALAAGPGDWRTAGFPLAGLDYNHDLLATVTGLHGGPLPGRASLASAEPATAVLSRAQAARQPARRRPAGHPGPGGRRHHAAAGRFRAGPGRPPPWPGCTQGWPPPARRAWWTKPPGPRCRCAAAPLKCRCRWRAARPWR